MVNYGNWLKNIRLHKVAYNTIAAMTLRSLSAATDDKCQGLAARGEAASFFYRKDAKAQSLLYIFLASLRLCGKKRYIETPEIAAKQFIFANYV